MFGLGEARDAHQQVYSDDENQPKFSHELIGAAAGFEGMRMFEKKQREDGKPVEHGLAKEILAGLAGGEADRLVETKGEDEIDKLEARRQAQDTSRNIYEQHYEQGLNADQYDPNQYPQPDLN